MPPRNATSRKEVPRDPISGQYRKSGPSTLRKLKHTQREKSYRRRRKEKSRVIHENFLHAVCVPGTSRDWIPGSRSEGALVEMLDTVLSPSHRIGGNGHVEGLREFCKAHTQLQQATGISQVRNSSRNPKRIRGFRLPKLTRLFTELSKLRGWLETLEKDELKANTIDEAFEKCKKILADFQVAQQRKGRQQQQDPSTSIPTADASVSTTTRITCPNCNVSLNASVGSVGTQQSTNSRLQESDVANGVETQVTGSGLVSNSTSPSTDPQPQGGVQTEEETLVFPDLSNESHDDSNHMRYGNEIIETAKEDVVFVMLCSIFDEGRETPYGWYGGQFLKEYRRRGEEPTPLVREMLIFCHWRRFGVQNIGAHERREDKLRYNMDLLKKARKGLGLQSYEELRWKYSSAPHHYAGLDLNGAGEGNPAVV